MANISGGLEKILVVDDTPMNLDLMEGILAPQGYVVDFAQSGDEAMEKINNNPPDLILLDVMMPKINGFEVCRRIRKNKALPFIPIIFITASEVSLKNVTEGLGIGGNDYIRKPFDRAELLARVIVCLRVKALYEELARTKAELSRYVSPPTRRMVESSVFGSGEPINRKAEVTVLFSDIRGFTHISEGSDPEALFNMLNINLSKQISIIEECGGIIDKLSGDEIMAVFEGHGMAENALQCAQQIIHELSASENRGELMLPYVGMGVNTGPVFMGSLGTQSFRDYTVIGTTVNIAARLCGLADKFQILFTEMSQKSIRQGKINFKPIGKKLLKGLINPVEVFQLIL